MDHLYGISDKYKAPETIPIDIIDVCILRGVKYQYISEMCRIVSILLPYNTTNFVQGFIKDVDNVERKMNMYHQKEEEEITKYLHKPKDN